MKNSEKTAQIIERMGRLLSSGYNTDGFKPVQWEALRYLSQANVFSRTPSALGEYLGVTKGSISQTLSTLEERGLLRKNTDKKDKRAVRLDLTAAGRAFVANGPLQNLIDSIESLSSVEQRELANSLEKILLKQLDSRDRKPFGQCRHCRHHRSENGKFRCNLLDVPLQESSIELICLEFESSSKTGS